MAFYPKATRRLIYPENNLPGNGGAPYLTTPDRKPTTFIYHSAVGSGSLYEYFGQSGVVLESHCWIGLNGQVEQYLDNTRKADANYKANAFAMSWETADNGHPDSFEWTPNQCLAIAESMVWGNELYGIPLSLPKSWDSPGMGYHTLFGAPSNWTPVAKSCPGKVRKAQFPLILEAARELKRVKDNPVADMTPDTKIIISNTAKNFLESRGTNVAESEGKPYVTYGFFLVWGYINQVQQLEELKKLNAQLDSVMSVSGNAIRTVEA